MSQPIKQMGFSSLSQQQHHQNQEQVSQSHNPSSFNTHPQNPDYAFYQPKGYPQHLPETGSVPEQAPIYQNTHNQGHGSEQIVGQQNPNYAYRQPEGYPQQLPENGSVSDLALNYQNTHSLGQGSEQIVGQQNPNYAYRHPEGYPQQIPENGSVPELALNHQSATAQGGQIGNTGYLTPAAAAAAVAALSQLVKFAGAAQQGQFAGSAAQSAFLGSGRRGSWPFRGRSTGRGRGRGRGRTGFSHVSQNSASSSLNPNSSADVVMEPTSVNQEEQKLETANPNKPASRAFRCELCKIECNGLDILEQHKNGKKHKKNMEKAGQLPPVAAVMTESENVAEKTMGENATTEPERGTKRKMRGGQSGKITRRVNEAQKLVIPKICDLCIVKCDTQEVFDRHLAGKKHMTKLKRYEGHQSMYGAVGLQALYPPMSQTLVQQQGPQQLYHVPQEPVPQTGAYMPPQHHYAAEPSLTGVESTVPGPAS